MFPEFLFNKAREIVSYIHTLTGKLLEEDETSKHMDPRKKEEFIHKVDPDIPVKHEPERDVSAI